jgi:hypothetical protein
MTERPIPAAAIAAAVELAQLFERDRELALALNEAQRRLLDGNDRLTAGLSAEALRGIYGPAGPDLGLSGRRPPVLEAEHPIAALEEVADTIRARSSTTRTAPRSAGGWASTSARPTRDSSPP